MTASEGTGPLRPPPPRVSIVIPAYNAERLLPVTLDSVRAQTFERWELVVHDDGSRDETVAVARAVAAEDARIRVAAGENGGVAAARNRGFASTDDRSKFVIFLDNDDVWEPDLLETLVGILDAQENFSAAHCIARCIDDEGRHVPDDDLEERLRRRHGYRDGRLVPIPPDQPTTFGDLVRENWVLTTGTLLIRRGVAERVGGFDPRTVPADDWDMGLRVSRLGDIGFVDRPLLQWRRHDDAQSRTSPHWRRAYFRVRAKTITDPSNTAEQTRSARRAYLDTCRATLRQARQCVAERHLGQAVHPTLLSLHRYALFARADVAARWRWAT